MSQQQPPADGDRKLIGNLTVADARHFLHLEGGERSALEFAVQLGSAILVAALTARAISVGNATVWHLVLPMVAQWLALITAVPLIYAVVRHPDLRKDAIGSIRLWAGIVVGVAVATAVRSRAENTAWTDQLARDAAVCWKWITDAEMHWPIVLAFIGSVVEVPGHVRDLYEFGPPFSGISLGCGMRVVVLVLGCGVLPWALGDQTRMAWTLWTMMLIAEFLAVWMHWDVQRHLRKAAPLDDAADGPEGVA